MNRDIWQGRLYTGNFCRCSLAQVNTVADTNNSRMRAIKVLSKDGPILLIDVDMCVYYLFVDLC